MSGRELREMPTRTPDDDQLVWIIDPEGVVVERVEAMRTAFFRVAQLAAPSLPGGSKRWHEAGWRLSGPVFR